MPVVIFKTKITVHFVCSWLIIFLINGQSRVFASEFAEVSPGNFVRFGVQQELSAENKNGIANIGFIIGSKSVAVIDPGGNAQDAQQLKAAVSKQTDLPISHVILTHFHPDHVLAGQAFAHVENVVAHRRYALAVAQRGEFYADVFGSLMSPSADIRWLMPTIKVEDKLVLDLGERRVIVTAFATAHTDNDLSVMDESTGTLWASDLVFSGRVPALDGSLTGWLSALDTLKALQPRVIVPGHGSVGNWDDIVQPQRAYLQTLLEHTRSALKAGLSLSATVQLSTPIDVEQWQLYELYHQRNVTKAYVELEWE